MKRKIKKVKPFMLILVVSIMIFSLGGIVSQVISNYNVSPPQQPVSIGGLFFGNIERQSPGNHVPEQNISVLPDQVIIDLQGAMWATYENTNSMDPVLDTEANGIEIKPVSEQQIDIGDIISFAEDKGIIVHRVIETGFDEGGWFARTKGDNNPSADSKKVRFEDIHGVLVGVIY